MCHLPATPPPPPRARNLFSALLLAERLIERCLALSVQAIQTDRAVPCPVCSGCSGPSDGQSGALPYLFRLFKPFRRTHSSFSSVVSRMGLRPPLLFHVSSRLSRIFMSGAMIWWYGVFLQSWPLAMFSCNPDFCRSVYKSLLLFATGCQLNPVGFLIPSFSDIPFKPVLWDYNDDTSHLQPFHSLFVIYPCSNVQYVK